ncbi:MAG: hypothetical protein H0V73_06035 [Chloroflexi bacterium]|nr:hypothetical protein [Chloroflexota bacterium]
MPGRIAVAALRRIGTSVARGSARGRPAVGAVAVAVVLLQSLAGEILAHGELTFQLGVERVQPGGTLEIRGDLGAGDQLEITLVAKSDGARRLIATIETAEEGHLHTFVTVPADVAVGDYLVEAAFELTVMRAPLTVAGPPIVEEPDEQPGQEEGLLVPMPPGFGSGSGASGGSASVGAGASASAFTDGAGSLAPIGIRRDPIEGMAAVGAGILAVAVVAGLRIRSGRRRDEPVARPPNTPNG